MRAKNERLRPRNQRISNTRQRRQQRLLDVRVRSHKATQYRNRRILVVVSKLVLLAALGTGIVVGVRVGAKRFFFENPDYQLSQIDIQTDGTLQRDQVLKMADVHEGVNIFGINLSQVRDRVQQLPQVDEVQVIRKLPGEIDIRIVERKPIAWITSDKQISDPFASEVAFLMDARGVLMKEKKLLPEYLGLPLITGCTSESLEAGKIVDSVEAKAALELLRLSTASFMQTRFQIREIDVSKGYCLVVSDKDHTQVTFGFDNLGAQLQRLEQFLVYADDSKRELATVNLLVQRNIPVTFGRNPVDVINDTLDPDAEPRIMKAIPISSFGKERTDTRVSKVAVDYNADGAEGDSVTQIEKGLGVDMSRSEIMVGLEIGTSKICVVVGESRPDGTIKILGVGQAPSRGVRKGEIVDFETAMKCVHEAVVDAETKSDYMINRVYVGVTGGHIQSFNNRGVVILPEDRDEIDDQDIDDVKINAREVSIPAQNAFLHSIIQHYHVDGQEGVLNPVGMLGQRLEADFHIIHGVRTRIQNTIRCVKELPLEVEDVAFTALASAQVVLTQHQKNLGALVIDIGGGTSDYILYVDGAVKQSGVLAVGGDHITNDISMGLRIPMTRAEKLKIEEGSVILGNALPGETILLKDDSGFAGREVERETLNTIIHLRLRETFELLRKKLEEEPFINYIGEGIFITGGCSHLSGIDNLAEEIFELPARVAHAQTMSGLTSAFENPQLSAAIGLIKYAQAMQTDRPPMRGLGRLLKIFQRN